MEKSKPIQKLEQVVIEALVSRGMSKGEAAAAIARLESLSDKPVAQEQPRKSQNQYAREEADRYESRRNEYYRKSWNSDNYTYKVIHGAECTVETPDAIKVWINNFDIRGKEYWIPKSQVAKQSPIQHMGDVGDLIIAAWLYNKRKWG